MGHKNSTAQRGELLVNDVVDISRKGLFCQKDVDLLLPIVLKITANYSEVVEGLISKLESLKPEQTESVKDLEDTINLKIKEWHIKIKKLGGVPKGLWIVDFDAGDGYFCWKYPEPELIYWHSYDEGFAKRRLLIDRPISNLNDFKSREDNPTLPTM